MEIIIATVGIVGRTILMTEELISFLVMCAAIIFFLYHFTKRLTTNNKLVFKPH